MSNSQRPDKWHGHHIVTEDELVDAFDPETSSVAEERARRRIHIRHGVVLVFLTVLLAAAAFSGWMVLSKQWVIPGLEPEASAPVDASCPTTIITYAENSSVTVNVYNATGKAGLASKVAAQLRDRDFKIGAVGNQRLRYDATIGVVISGVNGRSEALSVQRNVAGLQYVTDIRRKDKTVDVILGSQFKRMSTEEKVRTRPGKLNCLPETTSASQ